METLDPRSIGLTVALAGFALTAVLWAARRDGDPIAGVNAWLLSATTLAAGLFLNSLQELLPDALTRGAGNTLMVAAVALAWQGAREQRCGRASRLVLVVAVLGAALWNIAFIYVWPSARWRVLAYSASMAVVCLLAAVEFLRQRQPHLRVAARFAALPLLLFGVLMLLRCVDALQRTDIANALSRTPVNIATYLVGTVVLLCVVASMVMSVNAVRAAKIRELLYYDALTGALSRRGLYAMLPGWMGAHRNGATIAVLDTNGFKQINDTHGHAAGDRILQQLVECCRQRLPQTALVARFGGDEFVVLLPSAAPAAVLLEDVAAAFARTSRELLPHHAARTAPTVAIGHATIDAPDQEAFSQALKRADAVMYQQKLLARQTTPQPPAISHILPGA